MANAFMPLTMFVDKTVVQVRAASIDAVFDARGAGTIIWLHGAPMMVLEDKAAVTAGANAILTANIGLGI